MIPDSLQRCLVDYDMAMLRALAQNRGSTLTTNHQSEAVDLLAVALLEPLSVRTALARLSPEGREALDILLAAGGRMRAPYFARRFGQVRPYGPGRLERETPWQDPANATEELLYNGLIFRAFHQDEVGPGEFFFVPGDLLALLPQPQVRLPAFAVQTVPAPEGTSVAGGDGRQDLVHDLFAYLVYLHNHDVRSYADGRLGQRDLAALRAHLIDGDERRFAFLQHLAERLGFTVRQAEHLRLDPAPTRRWLTASPTRQVVALLAAWRDDPTWNDLCHVPGLECDPKPSWKNDPLATRRALLALLARCPLDAWWPLDSFVAAVKESNPDFQRPDGDYTSWYIRDTSSGDYLSGFESWDRVEGALIADLLHGPLRWLGLVITAAGETTAHGPATICRLSPAGARFLGLVQDEAEPEPSSPIIVDPDFRVEVPASASLYTQFQLERFAQLESKSPCRYRLTVGSLGRALARGIRVEQVLAYLEQAGDRPLPPNVAGQLRMWAGRFDQVELEEFTLLRTRNEGALKEISVLPETRDLIARVLSPTTALVRKRDLPRLRTALRNLGYLPPDDTSQG